jgi:hypothetical protein
LRKYFLTFLYLTLYQRRIISVKNFYIKANTWYLTENNTWLYNSKSIYLNFEQKVNQEKIIQKAFLHASKGITMFTQQRYEDRYGYHFHKISIYIDAIVNIDDKIICKCFYMGKFQYIPYYLENNSQELSELINKIKYPCGIITKIRFVAISG